jgi:hypothetical protein
MQTEYIDITPTWSDLLPSLVQVAVYGKNRDSVTTATNSLRHMAKQADRIADLEQQNHELVETLKRLWRDIQDMSDYEVVAEIHQKHEGAVRCAIAKSKKGAA